MGQIVRFNTAKGQLPALIQAVLAGTTVRLQVFGQSGPYMATNIAQGDKPGMWNWPPA